jgi:uncharacterized repeat protein (TIGR01451 family)
MLPGIEIVKTPSPTSFGADGELITYTFAVTNTGTAPLSNVLVSDPLTGLSAVDCAPEANPIVDLARPAGAVCADEAGVGRVRPQKQLAGKIQA